MVWAAAVFGGLAQSLSGLAGTLLARQLSGSDWAAGLPQGLLVAGSAVAAVTVGRIMARVGRRAGLVTGGLVAVLGCAAGVAAAWVGSLLVICLASVLLGWGTCAVMFARYAAADLAPPAARARAIAGVLAAVSVGAVAGPNLLAAAAPFEEWAHMPAHTGAYLISAGGFALATAAWWFGLASGASSPTTADDSSARPAAADRVRQRTGIGVLSLANLVMVATMTMAPVQMRMHDGSGVGLVGLVVSAHIAAMFGPSALSGRLVERAGERGATLVSCAVLAAATGTAVLSGSSATTLTVAMIMLGLGWNVATVAGSSMLTRGVPLRQRPRLEGRGEIGMGVAAAMGGGLSGVVMAAGGYPVLAAVGLAVVLCALLPLSIRRMPKEQLPTDVVSTSSRENISTTGRILID